MKFKLQKELEEFDELEERFSSEQSKQDHWDRHINTGKEYKMTADEYEQTADDLAKSPVDVTIYQPGGTITGYTTIGSKGGKVYCKYNKKTEFFVAYSHFPNGEVFIITAHRKTPAEFRKCIYGNRYPYVDELPDSER